MLHSSPSESIWIGKEAVNRLSRLIGEGNFSRIFFLTDENTHDKCLPVLLAELKGLPPTEVLEVAPGEDSKSPEVLLQLWYALAELQADRHSLILNVGGGVVTDLGGFVAGTYLRGIAFINVPTSLLAMVDASCGGKNGINLDNQKNRVGLFLDPLATCVWPGFLETLPQRERRSGFAEMLKHGLIRDADYWDECRVFDIEDERPSAEMIGRSVELKKQVVDQDFRESGLRKILNFGHTVGHALETASMAAENPLLHGEAIALGMLAELQLSVQYAGLSPKDAEEVSSAIRQIFHDLEFGFDIDELLPVMQGDKKNRGSEYRFSLLRKIGEAVPDVPVKEEEVVKVLKGMGF